MDCACLDVVGEEKAKRLNNKGSQQALNQKVSQLKIWNEFDSQWKIRCVGPNASKKSKRRQNNTVKSEVKYIRNKCAEIIEALSTWGVPATEPNICEALAIRFNERVMGRDRRTRVAEVVSKTGLIEYVEQNRSRSQQVENGYWRSTIFPGVPKI